MAKIGRLVAKIGRWVAKLVACLLATVSLWVRIQTSIKITKWAMGDGWLRREMRG
jgi:hypothetical protein